MKTVICFLLLSVPFAAQDTDITKALREIEAGNISAAQSILKQFQKEKPDDPAVLFLDAVLTDNGEEALQKYLAVYKKFPKSKYADASLYRIFNYYYSLGYYKKAEAYLVRLKSEYPNSPYIKSADRTIPDEEEAVDVAEEEKFYNFTIQAGAFLNLENAKKLADEIRGDGYPVEITSKEIGGSLLNIVSVGKFANEVEASPVLEFLFNKYNLKGRVISINNQR